MNHVAQSAATAITIVTVTYHSSRAEAKTLSANAEIIGDFQGVLRWIVVDNSEDSCDASYFAREIKQPNVEVICRPDNPGFAAGSNLGVRSARSQWIMLLNPDVLLESEKLRIVVTTVLSNPDTERTFAIGQVTDEQPHSGICLLANVWFTDRFPSTKRPLIGPSGGAGVYARETFLLHEGFDEHLFAWGEDADLALRLHSAGIDCTPIDVYFAHSGGHVHRDSRRLLKRKVWLLARNRQIIARKHYSFRRRCVFELICVAVGVLKAPAHMRRRTLGALVLGNWDGLRRGDYGPRY